MQKTYVVAVSGGVDSVVLLDVLVKARADLIASQSTYQPAKLIVAHFDHGIRHDSREDRLFVQELAASYGLPFVYDEGRLGPKASEAAARQARYYFLRQAKATAGARAIALAHHQDDVLETAIINLLRGTGRRGLSSLKSTAEIWRPMLDTPKANLIAYARANNLAWREDSTNTDVNYLRNYIRHRLLTRFNADARGRLLELIRASHQTNAEIDGLLLAQLSGQASADELGRVWFIALPHSVAREIIAAWLRAAGIRNFDSKAIERIVVLGKTLAPGKHIDVNATHYIEVHAKSLALTLHER